MIGKQFKFKLLDSSIPRTVTDVRNNFVIFDDGSRIEENRLNDMFDEIGTAASAQPVVTPTVNETAQTPVQNTLQDDVVNPETFFDSAKTASYITQEASKINTAQLDDQGSSYHGARVLEKPMEQPLPESPDGIKRVEHMREDFSEEDKRLAGYGQAKVDPYIPKSDLSSISFFQNLKRSKKVKLHVDIEEMIPKTDFIRMMDENFDGGVLNFLVTDIVQKMLKKPQILEGYVKDALEEIVYNKKRKPRTTRKPAVTEKKEDIEKKEDDVETNEDS